MSRLCFMGTITICVVMFSYMIQGHNIVKKTANHAFADSSTYIIVESTPLEEGGLSVNLEVVYEDGATHFPGAICALLNPEKTRQVLWVITNEKGNCLMYINQPSIFGALEVYQLGYKSVTIPIKMLKNKDSTIKVILVPTGEKLH